MPKRRRRRKIRTGDGVPEMVEHRGHVWTYGIVCDAVASVCALKDAQSFARSFVSVSRECPCWWFPPRPDYLIAESSPPCGVSCARRLGRRAQSSSRSRRSSETSRSRRATRFFNWTPSSCLDASTLFFLHSARLISVMTAFYTICRVGR